MKTYFVASALALLAAWAGPACAQKLIPAQSEISFTSKQMGAPMEGKFKKFDAQIGFDPKKPEAGSIAFSIDLSSVQIGDADTLAELAKPGWFDSKRMPQATFQSSGIKAAGPGKFDIAGKLNIKGNARDVTVPGTLTGNGPCGGMSVRPRVRNSSSDSDFGERPEPL